MAWTYPAGDTDFNPLVVRGVVYGRTRGTALVALDAATGKELWVHDGIEGFALRGVNYWESADGADRRLLFSARNMLRAIDAQTGKPIPSFGVDGASICVKDSIAIPKRSSSRAALPGTRVREPDHPRLGDQPRVHVGAGDIRAFDVRTGALVWTFRTVPRTGEFGADTWPDNARATVGGANDWAELSVDAARGIVYVPTSSAKYNFYGGYRHGDNLFANCILALDARTGKRLWHFQMVHHDIWDVDNNSAPQLTTVRHDGEAVDVVAGRVEDRLSLRVRSRDRQADLADRGASRAAGHARPGRKLSPTQPFPTKPEPFARQSFSVDDLNPHILRRRGARAVPAAHRQGAQRRAVHADRLRGSGAHAGQPGRIELGQHGGKSRERARVRDRLQRADDHPAAEAGREAPGARERAGGNRAAKAIR